MITIRLLDGSSVSFVPKLCPEYRRYWPFGIDLHPLGRVLFPDSEDEEVAFNAFNPECN